VGTTGVIFAAIAIAWLAYLVSHFVRHRDDEEELDSDPADRFSDSMRIVRHGTAPLLDHDLEEIACFDVSTPQTRRAAVNDLRRLERLAASRRRRVLLGLLAVLSAVIGLCAAHLIPWWSAAIPAGLLLIFVGVARISVRFMRTRLEVRYREIRHGNNESTIFLSRKDFPQIGKDAHGRGGKTNASKSGVLWDPIPITMPTYVSKPLAPRTVRTIDLSGPAVASSSSRPEGPVTADAPASLSDSPEASPGQETPKSASA
jgi:hypothetical protein